MTQVPHGICAWYYTHATHRSNTHITTEHAVAIYFEYRTVVVVYCIYSIITCDVMQHNAKYGYFTVTQLPVCSLQSQYSRKKRGKRKVYALRRYNGSFSTQKQPETAALRALKAASRKGKQNDPKGGQPA